MKRLLRGLRSALTMPRHISLERGDQGLSDSGAGWPEAWPGRRQGAGQNILPCIRGVPHRSERTDQISQILSELLVGLGQGRGNILGTKRPLQLHCQAHFQIINMTEAHCKIINMTGTFRSQAHNSDYCSGMRGQ